MLLEPKQHLEQVTMVLEKLVEITTGITKEEMSQPVFAGLAMLSHPELHDVSLYKPSGVDTSIFFIPGI